MVITDMRMENDEAGAEVIQAARAADYHPAVALLTAFPVADEDWQEMGADQLLVKPMHTRILLEQIEDLIQSHEQKLVNLGIPVATEPLFQPAPAKKSATKKNAAKKPLAKKNPQETAAKKTVKRPAKKPLRKSSAKKAAKSAPRRKPGASARRRRP